MTKTALFALALIASASTVSPTVSAAAEPGTVTSIVQTADLDLSSAAGQRKLDRRIVRAAYDVCGTASDIDIKGKNDVRQCRKDVIASASAQRDQPLAAASSGAPVLIASTR